MQIYYGTRKIKAKPMTLGDYNKLRKRATSSYEDPDRHGYLVEYLDDGKANIEGFGNYIIWSPKDVFEAAYKPTNAMSFEHALFALKEGKKVRHEGMLSCRFFKLSDSGNVINVYDDGEFNKELTECDFNDEMLLRNDWQIVE